MTLFDLIVIIFQRIILSECYDGPLNGAKSNVALKTGMSITAWRFCWVVTRYKSVQTTKMAFQH